MDRPLCQAQFSFFLFRSEAVRVALTRKASSTSPFPERISCGRFFSRTPTGRKVRCLALTVLVQCRAPVHTCHVPFDAGSEYAMGTCIRFVGSGREENANNSYPHKVMLIRTVTKRDTNVFTNRVEAWHKCFYKSCRSVMQLFLRTAPKCQTMQRLLCYGWLKYSLKNEKVLKSDRWIKQAKIICGN